MLGYREGVLEHFGKASARLDDVLNFLPARLAAALLSIAAPFGRGRVCSALVTAFREHRRTASPNAGWTMAAMAGALGVVLEKRGHYRLGEAGAAPTSHDIARSVRIALAACGAAILLFLLIGRVIR
jgi:adenosylcobinamide-phosphate synthase